MKKLKVTLSFRTSKANKAIIKKLAKREGKTLSAYVEMLVERTLNQ